MSSQTGRGEKNIVTSFLEMFTPGGGKKDGAQNGSTHVSSPEQARDLMQRFFESAPAATHEEVIVVADEDVDEEKQAQIPAAEQERAQAAQEALAANAVRQPARFSMPFVPDPSMHDRTGRVEFGPPAAPRSEASLAYVDMLTELPNRRAIEARLSEALSGANRGSGYVGVVFFDIDGFKDVNDSFGHQVGDAVLIEFANRIRALKRSADMVGRFGGDEFAAIYPSVTSHEELSDAAARIGAIFAEPVAVAGERFTLSASIGVSIYPRDGSTSEELIEHADAAMYRAKSEGKAAIRWYSDELGEELRARRRLLDDLSAVDIRRQLFLAYQPILDVGTHEMIAAEAFLRWLHPTRGLLSAGDVIDTTGGVPSAIDLWCVSQVVAHIAEWTRRGFPLKVHVNISTPSDELLDRAVEYLENAKLSPNLLALEIPEDVVIKGTHDIARFVTRARAAGIEVLLDRFTGAMSLSALRRLEFSAIKLSPRIVGQLEENREAQTVVRAAINVAHTFGWSVIASGVERANQQAWLFDSGLRILQGSGKATPVAYPDFTLWLSSNFAATDPHNA
ncbi:MAG TPA: diguanylate cyclase [Candidatus Baltobacteraceae bacterium]|jgi:diguanylate cyclase (GGDEF)-like protein